MMTIEQIRNLDRQSDPTKLLPTTIAFLKEMRVEENAGRVRRGEELRPWTAADEARW